MLGEGEHVPRCFVLLWLSLLMLGFAQRASAQTHAGSKLRLGAAAVFDFGGAADPDFGGPGSARDEALKFTPGVRLHLDYEVHRFVSLGGFARASWWESKDAFYNRSFLLDLGLRATAHYALRNLRFSLSFMLGPTLSVLNDLAFGTKDAGFGVAVAFAPGIEWWFSRKAGLFMEVFGFSGHYFSHGYESGPGDLDLRMKQVLWQFGFVFSL